MKQWANATESVNENEAFLLVKTRNKGEKREHQQGPNVKVLESIH